MTEILIAGQPYPVAVSKTDGLLHRVVDVGGPVEETWSDWSGGMGETERKSKRGYFFSDGWDATQEGVLRFSSTVKALVSTALSTGHGYFFEATGAAGTPTFDAASTTSATAANSFSLSHTIASQDNRLLIAFTHAQGTFPDTASVICSGIPMTRVARINRTGLMSTAAWILVNPPTGANTIVIASNGASFDWEVNALSYYGMNTKDPIRSIAGAHGASTAPSTAVASATNDLVVDGLGAATAGTAAAGAGQTERVDTTTEFRQGASEEAGAGSVTMNWTLGSAADWTILALSLKPSTAVYYYCADASAQYLTSTAGGAIWKLTYDSDAGPVEVLALAQSTVTAGSTSTTLEDSTAPFGGASAYVNRIVKLTGGTGSGQYRRISAHDTNTLTVSTWDVTPDTSTTYVVLDSHWVSGATFGRPAYFISKWKVPAGAGVNTEELTTVAAPLSLDTWTSKADPDALHFSTYQKGTGAHLAGASTASTIGSSASADVALTALGTVGDTSTSITDLIESQGFLFVPKEDAFYELDSDGVTRPVDIGLSRGNVDNQNGRTSAAFGDVIISPYNSLLRYQIGSGMIPIGIEELPGFRRVENTGIVPPKDRKPVACARAGKYLYTCYNNTAKSMLTQGRYRGSGDPPGPEWLWHSIRDLSLCKGMFVDSQNRLWLKGADPDSAQRAFQVIELDKQGGLDTQYRRGAISEIYTFFADEWIPNDGEQVQLRTFEIELAGGWSAQTSLALQVYRDNGNSAESVGSAVTAAGVPIKNWTTGTTDTAYRVRPVLAVTTGATYAPLTTDPTAIRFRIKGRKPMIYRDVIDANDIVLQEFGLTSEDARQALYRLQDQGVIAFNEPGPSGPNPTSFSAEVIAVQDVRYETPQGIGYGIEVISRRYVAD